MHSLSSEVFGNGKGVWVLAGGYIQSGLSSGIRDSDHGHSIISQDKVKGRVHMACLVMDSIYHGGLTRFGQQGGSDERCQGSLKIGYSDTQS